MSPAMSADAKIFFPPMEYEETCLYYESFLLPNKQRQFLILIAWNMKRKEKYNPEDWKALIFFVPVIDDIAYIFPNSWLLL